MNNNFQFVPVSHWFDCEHPKLVRNRYTGELIQVPCGSCAACKVRKMSRWVPPLIQERTSHKYAFFVTLTYNNTFLPRVDINSLPTSKNYETFKTLCEQSKEFIDLYKGFIPFCPSFDIKNFHKRLRENIFRACGRRGTYRYFFSSDYGSTLFRPHWHGIIFTSDNYVATNIASLIRKSWSFYNKSRDKRYSLGFIEVEHARGAAQYVASYIQSIDRLPPIYNFTGLRTRSFHSSFPPLGSSVSSIESVDEIVRRGLTQITVYDVKSCQWRQTALLPHLVRRLFPTIPSFSSLSRTERLEVYRTFYDVVDLTPKERRFELRQRMKWDSFFYDYVTLNDSSLSFSQINDKLDRIHYAFSRLLMQANSYGMHYADYDLLVSQYYQNRLNLSLKKQFDYEQRFSLVNNDNELLNNIIDLAYNANERKCRSFSCSPIVKPTPYSIDSDYFVIQHQKFNRIIKRKCDNAYLDSHPEFKKFHS